MLLLSLSADPTRPSPTLTPTLTLIPCAQACCIRLLDRPFAKVATVAIGNSMNAGLLAVRILGVANDDLLRQMDSFMCQHEQEVLQKADAMKVRVRVRVRVRLVLYKRFRGSRQ